MGRKNKKYQKTLHQQVYDRLTSMLAPGESKREAMLDGTARDKIFSYNTYQTYFKHCKYFVGWLRENHPDVTTLKAAKKYVNEWLQSRVDYVDKRGSPLSAYTITTEVAAVSKLFGISGDDPGRFQPPVRHREDIRRSRVVCTKDKHFSVTNNAELINFARGTGLRRSGIQELKGRDLWDKARIAEKIREIKAIPFDSRTKEERRMLEVCKETEIYGDKATHFLYVKEKNGRERLAPIIGPHKDDILRRVQETPTDKKVWLHVSANADIHSYRADYSKSIYRMYARDIESIPYDRINKGSGKRYQSEVYVCRKDEYGLRLDKGAMLIASKALGHNRIDIIAGNYLHGL